MVGEGNGGIKSGDSIATDDLMRNRGEVHIECLCIYDLAILVRRGLSLVLSCHQGAILSQNVEHLFV